MSEDRRLALLGRRSRDQVAEGEARYPGHWDELSAGTLEPAAAARLRAAGEDSEDARAAYEVFRPMSTDFHARMVARIQNLAADEPAAEKPAAEPLADVAPGPRPAVSASPPARGYRGWHLAAAAGLATLVFGLYWLAPRDGGTPLPRFSLELDGIAIERNHAETPPVAVLAAGSSFTVLLSPENEVEGTVGARFFAIRDGRWRRFDLELETAPTGALRFVGSMTGDLVLEPGRWTLVAAVGRRRALPTEIEIRERRAAGDDAPAGGWQLLEIPFTVERGRGD